VKIKRKDKKENCVISRQRNEKEKLISHKIKRDGKNVLKNLPQPDNCKLPFYDGK
jgi:hypothetical protein